jgi:transposase InsO family protein
VIVLPHPFRCELLDVRQVIPVVLRQPFITYRAVEAFHVGVLLRLARLDIVQARGFVYLTAVVDWASRKVLAHRVAITMEAMHAVEALEEAFAKYGQPEIVNTGQGSQFTATVFTEAVLSRGIRLSMDGKGAWRDNVFVERMWRSVKYEEVYLKAYESVGHPNDTIEAIHVESRLGSENANYANRAQKKT